MKRFLIALLCIGMVAIAGCGGTKEPAASAPAPAPEPAKQPEKITLNFFSANPDRTVAVGKVEQQIIDAYVKDHPNITIQVEALQDEPYKNKTKVYAANKELPDIMHVWGQPSFLAPLVQNNLLAELKEADFASYGFVPGSLDGFKSGGKLYGLPKGADMMVMYYNKQIFKDNNLQVPNTQAELLDVCKKLRAKGINPIAVNGMDAWSLPIWFEFTAQRANGSFVKMDDALARKASFSDAGFLAAAKFMSEMAKAKAFQDGFLTADYGAAKNLFGQGKAAMFFMGSWEMGMATDTNFPDAVRNNIAVMRYPAGDDGKTAKEDVAAWFGGGYAVSNTSKHKAEAMDFLKYMLKPENWAKLVWQSGAAIPAQKFSSFMTGQETQLQKDIVNVLETMKSSSGTPVLDAATPAFKESIMKSHQSLLAGSITPEEFLKQVDAAAETAAKAQ
ncbi:MAG TPA: extracellular solute-binding protein [Symbiobacteriaceae bacterium]|nr:extracellular solute-binding protein [Symbiobacteriaceae bacterium]